MSIRQSPFEAHPGSEDDLLEFIKDNSQYKTARLLGEKYDDERFNRSAVLRRLRKLGYLCEGEVRFAHNDGEVDLGEVKALIRCGKLSLEEVCDHLNVCPAKAREAIDKLIEQNTLVELVDDHLSLSNTIPPSSEPFVIDFRKHVEKVTPIGMIADTHLGSKYERLDALEAIYDRFVEAGVKQVYLAGNMIDGESKFNKYDIHQHGFEDQLAYFVKKFPHRDGITTYVLTGDDHEGWYIQRENINVGKTLEDRAHEAGRKDIVYLGHVEQDVQFVQKNGSSTLRVIHAGGGSAYALSYTSQKYVEMLAGGEKPQIVLVGHFHKFDWCYPRNVHVIQPGSFKDQDTWMRKKRIQSVVGGCICWIRQNDMGLFTSVKVEFFPYYDKTFYVHRW